MSESGYCYDFKIYTGSDKINSNNSKTQSVLHKGLLT